MSTHTLDFAGVVSGSERLLLGGWLDIADAVAALGDDVDTMPDFAARCSDVRRGDGCARNPSVLECAECRVRLKQVAERMGTLVDAMIRFAPTTASVLDAHEGQEGRRALSSLMEEVFVADRLWRRIQTHSGQYSQHCSLIYLDRLGGVVTRLRTGVQEVNARLR